MIRSTSSASNMHGVVENNNNSYRNMVMDVMRMNQGHVGQCSVLDEELNAKVARFFDLLKDFDKLLWDGCTSHSRLSKWLKSYLSTNSLRVCVFLIDIP